MVILRKKYLMSEETILLTGLVWKKSFLFRRNYQVKLVLTSLPRFLLLDVKKPTVKEDIRWDPTECVVHLQSASTFFIRTVSL
jgi:hypothetical protein